MSWAHFHSASERFASEAELALRLGDAERAKALYAEAAENEKQAADALPPEKAKTLGITAVSAVSLLQKAHMFAAAELFAHRSLANDTLPVFAQHQLKNMLQVLWTTRAAEATGVTFLSGTVLVSVKGGQVVYGGAPLDLIVNKVSEVQAVFYRTIEMLTGRPFRRRGAPSSEVVGLMTPWLFQVPAGSYQFAVRVQEPPQVEMFARDTPKVAEVADTFIDVLQAVVSNPEEKLVQLVPDRDYRTAFLKLARNLAPTGKRYDQLDIVDVSAPVSRSVSLVKDARENINRAIRQERPGAALATRGQIRELRGLLRGLHLDQDWLEVTQDSDGQHIRIQDAGEALDDVVGPMVNRRVVVTVEVAGTSRLLLRDIELDE